MQRQRTPVGSACAQCGARRLLDEHDFCERCILDAHRFAVALQTFASRALAAGVSVFELARIMGTSPAMIERHYGRLLDGAGAGITGRLDAFEAAQEQAADERLGH
jgi:hypothetical protein